MEIVPSSKNCINKVLSIDKMNKKAFTLIEVLVAISIVAVLMSLALVSYGGSRAQARDAQRKSDLNQYRNALENFASANSGIYTSRASRREAEVLCNPSAGEPGELDPNFISSCPIDPRFYNGSLEGYRYYYHSNGSGAGVIDATRYVLFAKLESGQFWEVCSDGRTGVIADPDQSPPPSDDGGVCAVP